MVSGPPHWPAEANAARLAVSFFWITPSTPVQRFNLLTPGLCFLLEQISCHPYVFLLALRKCRTKHHLALKNARVGTAVPHLGARFGKPEQKPVPMRENSE